MKRSIEDTARRITTGNRAERRLRWSVWGEDVLSRDSTGRAEKEGEESPQEAVQ